MPEFSGLDVIKSLKEEGGIESKNIVIFTASSYRNIMDKIKDSGIKEILKKPCSLENYKINREIPPSTLEDLSTHYLYMVRF